MVRNRAGEKAAFPRSPHENILFSFLNYGLGVDLGEENQEQSEAERLTCPPQVCFHMISMSL